MTEINNTSTFLILGICYLHIGNLHIIRNSRLI